MKPNHKNTNNNNNKKAYIQNPKEKNYKQRTTKFTNITLELKG